MQLRVREVTTRGELSGLQPQWDEVVQRSGDGSLFVSFDWITTWWDHFDGGRELLVLVAEDDEGIAGIAPFAIGRYRYLRISLRVLEFIGAPFRGRSLSTRLNLIVSRRHEQCLAGFAEAMAGNANRWDLCSLRGVPATSVHLERLSSLQGYPLTLLSAGVNQVAFIPLLGREWSKYLESRSRSFRYWLRRIQQRAEKAGMGPVERVESLRGLEAVLPHLSRVCEASWKAAQDKGMFFSRDATAEFLAAFLRRVCANGGLLLTTLSSHQQIIAYHLALFHSGTLWFYDTAYDTEYGRAAPGFNLFAHMIQEGFRARVDRIDLGPGLQPYKMRWADDREERVHWLGFHRRRRSRLLQFGARWAVRLRQLKARRGEHPSSSSEGASR
jgi:CelD/BcsL family acetyltransferase involved in cellulose biosynthesis